MMSKIKLSNYKRFIQFLQKENQLSFSDYQELHTWSVTHQADFWESIARFFSITFDKPCSSVMNFSENPWETTWFTEAEISYAKHVFSQFSNDRPALIYRSESNPLTEISWQALQNKTVQIQQQLLALGVQQGDCVAAYSVNAPETIAAFLAVNGLGAIWSSCSPDFGSDAVLERFSQLQPKVLFVHSRYTYKGKQFDINQRVAAFQGEEGLENCDFIDLCEFNSFDDPDANDNELHLTPVSFSDPIWILFSSGTTGKPKAIIHGTGAMILEHQKALAIHQDVCEGDRYFWNSTTGWMMWNYALSSLLCGATLCLYNGAPNHPKESTLWDFAHQANINHFGHGAVYFQHHADQGFLEIELLDFQHLKTIGSTGSPLSAKTCQLLQNRFPNAQVISLSGGTDVCTAFVGGHPEMKVIPGEIQCKMLGAPVEVWNTHGDKILNRAGELVLSKPFLPMPIGLWGDTDNRLMQASYYGMYAQVWNHGDWATENDTGSFIIHGRSDATLNRQGVRIGTAEIYNTLNKRENLMDSLVIHLTNDKQDSLLLFVVAQAEVDEKEIRAQLREQCSPRHVPDHIICVPDIPYTLSGKKVEIPIKRLLMGASINNVMRLGSLQNPDSINWFVDYAKSNSFT
jgi:acetoacetyl-CoA synthetase